MALEGIFSGAKGFLIGGSPRLLELDLRLLRLQGAWSLAINNAAVVIEPQAFVCLDTSRCFNNNIFSNPRIMKFINYSRNDELVDGKKLCHFPNTFFFDMSDESEIMMSEFCRLEGPLPFWRNTFFTALALMYQLGFREIYLIGCTFDTSKGAYAFDQKIDDVDKQYNQSTYDEAVENMMNLVPMLKDEGMSVMTCHDGTNLDGICQYVPFEKAISDVAVESTSLTFNITEHVNKVHS